MAIHIFFALGKGLGNYAPDVVPENEIPLNKPIYTFVVLSVDFDCFADPSCHSNHAHTLTEHVELCVYGRQKLNPDILSLLDSWSESLSFRELCNTVCGCYGGYSIDTGTNLSLSSTFCRIQL